MTPTITSVRLVNIGPFADVTVPFPPALRGPDCGQVLAVAGSEGKTTFLRALALALVSPTAQDALPGSGVRLVGSQKPGAEVLVGFGGGVSSAQYTLLQPSGTAAFVDFRRNAKGVFVVAYGAHRNAPDQQQDAMAPRVETDERGRGFLTGTAWCAIASLFGERRLCSVWAVLSNLHRFKILHASAFRDIPAARVADMQAAYGAVTTALSSAVGVRVQMGERDVLVDGRPLPLAGDGVRGRLRWVTDMLARWIDREWRAGREVGEHFARQMRGVCIVDALDEGLSPRGQESVIRDFKRVFPGVTLVASVYAEPTVRGWRDELVVFEPADDGCGAGVDVRDQLSSRRGSTDWFW